MNPATVKAANKIPHDVRRRVEGESDRETSLHRGCQAVGRCCRSGVRPSEGDGLAARVRSLGNVPRHEVEVAGAGVRGDDQAISVRIPHSVAWASDLLAGAVAARPLSRGGDLGENLLRFGAQNEADETRGDADDGGAGEKQDGHDLHLFFYFFLIIFKFGEKKKCTFRWCFQIIEECNYSCGL
ncbi:unnamed protein product [Rotaria socialis]|uniref:Uncharacterized protein n=1 Tax=Rotaria socialis TaxID=392032 RepID=A0A818X4F1_9BILA|nr:unnamed protein product [Rotaria socialis]CAF4921665.1 unnamed protein product [Rotaria socialis]